MSKLYVYPEIKKTIELLDKIDLIPFLKEDACIYDVMDACQEYIDHEANLSKIINDLEEEYFCGDVFNWLTHDDFMNYLQDKYGIKWIEYIEYRIA